MFLIGKSESIFGTKESGKIKREFSEYFYFGGFPETLNYQNKREYVSSIYQKVLLGDIAARNGIRNPNGLKLLMKKIAESVKDEISYSKLHNILKTIGVKISKDIVIDYIEYAKQSFLIFAIKNYFSNSLLEKEFGLPENEKVVLLMPIGYPAEDSVPLEKMHNVRKDIDKTVRYI